MNETATHSGDAGSVAECSPDSDLIAAVQRGEAVAYALIMRRYNQRLYRIARAVARNDADAQDVLQDSWVRAFNNLPKYAGSGDFGAWLSRITLNEALMQRRRMHREIADSVMVEREAVSLHGEPSQRPDHAAANDQLREMLEEAIEALPIGFRMVFMLRGVEQLSVRESAASLGIPEATVKTRFHRARNMLRERLERKMEVLGTELYEFAGARCDRVVTVVLARLDISPVNAPGERHS